MTRIVPAKKRTRLARLRAREWWQRLSPEERLFLKGSGGISEEEYWSRNKITKKGGDHTKDQPCGHRKQIATQALQEVVRARELFAAERALDSFAFEHLSGQQTGSFRAALFQLAIQHKIKGNLETLNRAFRALTFGQKIVSDFIRERRFDLKKDSWFTYFEYRRNRPEPCVPVIGWVRAFHELCEPEIGKIGTAARAVVPSEAFAINFARMPDEPFNPWGKEFWLKSHYAYAGLDTLTHLVQLPVSCFQIAGMELLSRKITSYSNPSEVYGWPEVNLHEVTRAIKLHEHSLDDRLRLPAELISTHIQKMREQEIDLVRKEACYKLKGIAERYPKCL